MFTDLFAVANRLDGRGVEATIPPACRRGVERAASPICEDGDLVLDFGPWRPRRAVRHLVASLSVLTDVDYTFRFEACAHTDGDWSRWVAASTIGEGELRVPAGPADARLEADIDVWTTSSPAGDVRLRLRVRAGDAAVLDAPWLVTLSASDPTLPLALPRRHGSRALDVPALSQVVEGGAIGVRICSPTSVAMVLGHLGARVDVPSLAARMLHRQLDLYGVWPAAIRAAGAHGAVGYLLRFPDWDSAAWCLDQDLPIIASVRYAEGELSGAAVAATRGHLLVLTGYDGDAVRVNDPAAPTSDAVARRYPLSEVTRVWLERAGVGYVLFRPPAR